uniref:Uncharacterized protein n=1 Tax=Anguilla anguilla TaxID=7936 RepID=A0A0E9PYI0_ANGAN
MTNLLVKPQLCCKIESIMMLSRLLERNIFCSLFIFCKV